MRHALVVILLLGIWIIPDQSQAFLCNNGKDLGCLASWILPGNQTAHPSEDYREWSASQGYVTGKDNFIIFKLRFNQESLNTLGYQNGWYSPQNTLFKGFGLEIDVCDPSGTLRFDTVKSDFPSAARATRDTDLSDNINKCKKCHGNVG